MIEIWLKWWSNTTSDRQYTFYPGVYALIQGLAMVALIEFARYVIVLGLEINL